MGAPWHSTEHIFRMTHTIAGREARIIVKSELHQDEWCMMPPVAHDAKTGEDISESIALAEECVIRDAATEDLYATQGKNVRL